MNDAEPHDPLPLGLRPEDFPPLPPGTLGWNIYNSLPAEPVFHGHVPAEALPVTADPDKPCPHQNFEALVEVNRVLPGDGSTEPAGFSADITVHCAACEEQFRWIGVPAGLNAGRPTCSVDEFTLHAPLRPASSDPDFGLGIPGFAITMGSP